MKPKKPRRYKYYTHMAWVENDIKHSLLTQLYEVLGSIYVAIYANGRIDAQFGIGPTTLGISQKKHIKRLKAKGIEVTLGPERVIFERESDGYWVEYTGE